MVLLKLNPKNADDYSSLLFASAVVMIPSLYFSSMPLLPVDQNPKMTFYILLIFGMHFLKEVSASYYYVLLLDANHCWYFESLVLLGEYSYWIWSCFVCLHALCEEKSNQSFLAICGVIYILSIILLQRFSVNGMYPTTSLLMMCLFLSLRRTKKALDLTRLSRLDSNVMASF